MIAINLLRDFAIPRVDRPVTSFGRSPRWETAALIGFVVAVVGVVFITKADWHLVFAAIYAPIIGGWILPYKLRRYVGGLVTGRRGARTRRIVDGNGAPLPREHEAFLHGIESAEDMLALRPMNWPDILIRRAVRLLPVRKHIPQRPQEFAVSGSDGPSPTVTP